MLCFHKMIMCLGRHFGFWKLSIVMRFSVVLQHVYSSSSSRDWQGKPQFSQQDAYDRYNYRGQDYNKRHKEPGGSTIERGGERMKLSTNFSLKGRQFLIL